jgi:isoleucyl-tRNA synthetase
MLDRWLVSRLNTLAGEVREELEKYEIHRATRLIEDFVMEDLSNWYIRRSRKRFWTEELNEDKRAGYSTLHEALTTVARFAAPFAPFITDEIYRKAVDSDDSVHLADFPEMDGSLVDGALESSMGWCKELAEAGRRLRSRANIKTRQPLPRAIVVPRGEVTIAGLEPLLADEINVKSLETGKDLGDFQETAVRPNTRTLGPKFRRHAKAIAEAVEALDPSEAARMMARGSIKIKGPEGEVELGPEDIIVEHKADERYQITETADYAFVLDTEISDELLAEGMARELVRRMQQMRKEMDLEVDQMVRAVVECEPDLAGMAGTWIDYIKTEVRAADLELGGKATAGHVKEWDIDGRKVKISLEVVAR